MGRVLRIGAGVMGVLLVVMTAGLWIRRSTTEPEYSATFVTRDYEGASALELFVPEIHYARRITPEYDFFVAFTPPEDKVYRLYLATEPVTGITHLYRFRLNQWERVSDAKLTFGSYGRNYLSPDEQWMAYEAYEGNHLYGCYVQNVQTGETLNIPRLFSFFLSELCSHFSADSQWYWFHVPQGYDPTSWKNIYRIRLSDGFLDRVNERFRGATIEAGSIDGSWVIGRIDEDGFPSNQLFRANPQSLDWQPILDLAPAKLFKASYHEEVEAWLPEHDLAIVRVSYTKAFQQLMGIPMPGGTPHWVMSHLTYLSSINHPEWLFFHDEQSSLYRMRPDGTSFTQIVRLPLGHRLNRTQLITDASDTQWIYLDVLSPNSGGAIWRMRLDGTHFEQVLIHPSDASIESVSPDHQWLLVKTLIPYSWGSDYYRIGLDGSHKTLVLTEYSNFHTFFAWYLTHLNLTHPILLLVSGGGLIGISIFGKRPYHLMRHRRRPAA